MSNVEFASLSIKNETEMLKILKYGKTNTFLITSGNSSILIDPDWAGTLPMFFKEIKKHGVTAKSIKYMLITHYHPDHMGIVGELQKLGIQLVVIDIQKNYLHSSDRIFKRENQGGYVPIEDEKVLTLSCEESRSFLKKMNIDGEIIHTPGHSDDSISIILDAGIAIVGDLYTLDTITAYNDDILNGSWNKILSRNINKVYYGHAKEKNLCGVHSVDDFMRKDD